MKQTTLKSLLIVTFCSLALNTITPNLLHADGKKEGKDGVKIKLEGNLAEGGLNLSIEGNHKFVLSDDKSSAIQHLQSKIVLKNPLSNKTHNKIIKAFKDQDIDVALQKSFKELIKELSVKSNPMLVLEDKELTAKIGFEKPKFCPELALGIYGTLDKLPYGIKVGLGIYFNVLDDYKFQSPLELVKKGLLSEEDSISFNTAFSWGETYDITHGYLSFAEPLLKRLGGVSIAYKTGSKEDILNSASLSCSSPIVRGTKVKNKPAVKLAVKLNGAPMSDFGFSSVCNMLPEKMQALCGSLDSVSFSLTNHFDKKHQVTPAVRGGAAAVYEQRFIASKLEHVTLGATTTFKDVCQTKGTNITIGFNLKISKPDPGHEDRFSLVVKFSKTFDLI